MKNLNLMKARKAMGLTQSDLASMLNYTKQAVSNWENGYSTPRISDAIKISEILNRDINYLFLKPKVQDSHTNLA